MNAVSAKDVVDIIRKVRFKWALANLDLNKRLTEQGADSLDMTTLIFELEEFFGVTISDESLAKGIWGSINQIADNVNRLRQGISV